MPGDISVTVTASEMAQSIAGRIESKVQRIRELREGIDEKKTTYGITDDEDEIAQSRADLLEMVRDYKELTSENWADGEGYARYVSGGESHRYDVKSVDEALAAILALTADLENLTTDNLTVVIEQESATVEVLSEMVKQVNESRVRLIEDVGLRLNALNVELKKLAAARKVSATVETVHVK